MRYKAKHAGKSNGPGKKLTALAVALVLIACCTVSGTLAFLVMDTSPVVNTFLPTDTSISIDEDFPIGSNVKNNVGIKNKGNIPAYVRAMVVVTWQNNAGDVYNVQPVEGVDYNIEWKYNDEDNDWLKGTDEFYYFTKAVNPGAVTEDILFTNCYPKTADVPNGYTLHVEVLGQSIQAEPDQAVVDAWGATAAGYVGVSAN